MDARDDRARPHIGEPDHAERGQAPASVGTRIAAGTLAAAGEVNRYYARRLAEHRQTAWPALDEVPTHEGGERS